jgi:hypothetical protein
MAQLMLINPAKRPSRRRKASPAQLRALAAGRRKRKGVAANPAPRRRRSLRAASRRRAPRRNPIGMSGITSSVFSAVQGAGGALAVNALYNLLPIPAGMKTGLAGSGTKMLLAVGLGMALKPMLGRTAGKMAEGAMTVAAFEAMQSFVPVNMGGNSIAGLGYMSPGMNAGAAQALPNQSVAGMSGMGEYVSGMGEYVYQ